MSKDEYDLMADSEKNKAIAATGMPLQGKIQDYSREIAARNEVLLSAKRVKNDSQETIWSLFFNKEHTMDLVGSSKRVWAVPINVDPKNLAGYSFEFKGQMKIDLSAPFINVKQVTAKDDVRGIIYAVTYRGDTRENEIYNFHATFAGMARGGHYHPYPVILYEPKGALQWYIGEIDEVLITKEPIIVTEGDDPLIIPANKTHYMVAKKDTLLIEVPLDGSPFEAVSDKNRAVVDLLTEEAKKRVILSFSKRE